MKTDLSDLPDEVAELIKPHIVNTAETLAAIGLAIAKRRDDAKAARTSSGIETTWRECEEAYIGIDDANRQEFQDARWAKPMAMDGPITTGKTPQQTEHKSTAFVRLTARYVDAGSAKLGEILLPADDKAFKFSEMPIPELIKAKEDTSQVVHSDLGVPLTRPAKPGEAVPGSNPAPATAPMLGGAVPTPGSAAAPLPAGLAPLTAGSGAAGQPGIMGTTALTPPQEVPLTVQDLAEENIEIARKAAKAAETRIYGWMIECQRSAEVRKIIDDAARIGVGVLNGPIPSVKKYVAIEKSENGNVNVIIKQKIIPSSRWRDPWNIFPDPACGENIHNGDFLLDRDFLSQRQVRDLKDIPGYIKSQIDKVIKEGPGGPGKDEDLGAGGSPDAAKAKGRFEVWYYYGSLKKSEMGVVWAAAGKSTKELDDLPADKSEVYAIVTLINESVVRATINPLDSGSFPYHSVPWRRRAGHWAGIGVSEQIRMPQRLINQATRAAINNAGKSSGSQIVIDRGAITPADGIWTITPDKIWNKSADAPGSVQDAFAMHKIENVTTELMELINYALRLAEESTSIPLITQGMSGETQPDTLGAANLQNNNANQLLRSIGYAFDDHITEPEIRQYYEWFLLDPEVPDEEKGDFTINAHGSVALVERAIQDQTIAQMGTMVLNPAFGVNPKKWAKVFFKSKRLVPEDLQYTPEEQKKIDEAPPPVAPAVQVAQIAARTAATQIAAKQGDAGQDRAHEERLAQAAAILDGSKVQAENNRTVVDHIGRLHEIQAEHQRDVLRYALMHNMKVEDVKAMLTKTAMTLDVQRELNATDHLVDLHKHGKDAAVEHAAQVAAPAAEVPGRAPNGQAFEK